MPRPSPLPLLAGLLLAVVAPGTSEARPAPPRARIAMLGVAAGEGIGEKTAATVEEILLTAMHRTERFDVVGRSDIANLIGFERQKQLAGCKEDISCAAEIAGVLGVALLASASIGRLGPVTVVNLKIIDVAKARVVARAEARPGAEAELPAALDRLVAEAVAGCAREGCFGPSTLPAHPEPVEGRPVARDERTDRLPDAAARPEPATPGGRRSPIWAWTAAGAAAVAAIAGVIVGWQAQAALEGDHAVNGEARTHSLTQVQGQRAADLRTGANVLFGCAGALGVGAGVLFVF